MDKRFYYYGFLAFGRLHYYVIDGHYGYPIARYRQIKRAKQLTRDLNV